MSKISAKNDNDRDDEDGCRGIMLRNSTNSILGLDETSCAAIVGVLGRCCCCCCIRVVMKGSMERVCVWRLARCLGVGNRPSNKDKIHSTLMRLEKQGTVECRMKGRRRVIRYLSTGMKNSVPRGRLRGKWIFPTVDSRPALLGNRSLKSARGGLGMVTVVDLSQTR